MDWRTPCPIYDYPRSVVFAPVYAAAVESTIRDQEVEISNKSWLEVLETVYSPAAVATPFEWRSSEGSSVDDGDQRSSRRSSKGLCSRRRGHRFEQPAPAFRHRDGKAHLAGHSWLGFVNGPGLRLRPRNPREGLASLLS
ncbi:hypothetical protein MRX96_056386 [Rhipicephalus microplus]